MAAKLTLMAVHAHPDDESSSTGGVLATTSDTLIAGGIDVCFTNPGTSEMHIVAALEHALVARPGQHRPFGRSGARAPHLAHSAFADAGDDFIRSELFAGRKFH